MRNHFIPQFLQRPWLGDDKRVQVFRLTDGKTYRQAPKGNGYDDDMLSLTRDTVAGMDKHAIEKILLQTVDHEANLVRQKLEDGQLASLTYVERCAWVRFIMSLQMRQPHIVAQLRTEAAEVLRQKLAEEPEKYQAIAGTDDFPTLEAWTEAAFPGAIENFGLSFFHELLNNEEVGTKLLRLQWWVRDFGDCDHHLLLGDRACVFAGGIDHPNLAVMLPIAPKKAFLATRGEATAQALMTAHSPALLRNFNDATVLQADARIFALDTRPATFIRNRRPINQA